MTVSVSQLVTVQKPDFSKAVTAEKEVEFSGTADSSVTEVTIVADGKFAVGNAPVKNGKWAFKKSMHTPGMRSLEVTGLGADHKALFRQTLGLVVNSEVSDQRQKLVKFATSKVGVFHEDSANFGQSLLPIHRFIFQGMSDSQIAALTADNREWCLMFCNFCIHETTGNDPGWGRSLAFVPGLAAWAKNNSRWIREQDPHDKSIAKGSPKPGDLIVMGDFIQLGSKNNYPHVAMVRGVTTDTILTVEGNVGDTVGLRSHSRLLNEGGGESARYIAGYVRTFKD